MRKKEAVQALRPTNKQQFAKINQKVPKSLSIFDLHFLNLKR